MGGRGKTEEEELEGEEEDGGGGETAKWLADASSSCTVIFAHSVKLYCSSHHAVFRESVCVCAFHVCSDHLSCSPVVYSLSSFTVVDTGCRYALVLKGGGGGGGWWWCWCWW